MSRPSPKVLLEFTNRQYRSEQVLAAEGVYAVTLEGQPVGLRRQEVLRDVPAKYSRTTFVNPGHAFNLAERLNKLYRTDKFGVMEMAMGEMITED